MRTCQKCRKDFKTYVVIDGIKRILGNRKFCLRCSPFGAHNTRATLEPRSTRLICGCGRKYKLDRSKGHSIDGCNSCTQRRKQLDKRERLKSFFGGACQLCGYDRCVTALDYHHVDPATKLFEISTGLNRSWSKVLAEAKKCVLICSNCHREIHSGLIPKEAVNACWVSKVKAPPLQGGDAGFDPQSTHKA